MYSTHLFLHKFIHLFKCITQYTHLFYTFMTFFGYIVRINLLLTLKRADLYSYINI